MRFSARATSVHPAGSENSCPFSSRRWTRSSPQFWRWTTNSKSRPCSGWNGWVTRTRRYRSCGTGVVDDAGQRDLRTDDRRPAPGVLDRLPIVDEHQVRQVLTEYLLHLQHGPGASRSRPAHTSSSRQPAAGADQPRRPPNPPEAGTRGTRPRVLHRRLTTPVVTEKRRSLPESYFRALQARRAAPREQAAEIRARRLLRDLLEAGGSGRWRAPF